MCAIKVNLASSVRYNTSDNFSEERPKVFIHWSVPSLTAVSRLPRSGYATVCVKVTNGRIECELNLVRYWLAISVLEYNHNSPFWLFSSSSKATSKSISCSVASEFAMSFAATSSAVCGLSESCNTSNIPRSHAAITDRDARNPR